MDDMVSRMTASKQGWDELQRRKALQALADKRLELLKAAPVTQPYMRASDIDQWFDDYDKWRARVAEAIDAA